MYFFQKSILTTKKMSNIDLRSCDIIPACLLPRQIKSLCSLRSCLQLLCPWLFLQLCSSFVYIRFSELMVSAWRNLKEHYYLRFKQLFGLKIIYISISVSHITTINLYFSCYIHIIFVLLEAEPIILIYVYLSQRH